jgi:hypothetical protein
MTGEIVILVAAIAVLVWVMYSTVIGGRLGAPYVATPDKTTENILKGADLKPGENFWDLGCGDGRVVKVAMKIYGVVGWGVEFNPILAALCLLKAIKVFWNKIENVDLSNADVVYMYLGPGIVDQVAEKLEKESTKQVRVISRRFEIKRWKNKLTKKIPDGNNWVYFYFLRKLSCSKY